MVISKFWSVIKTTWQKKRWRNVIFSLWLAIRQINDSNAVTVETQSSQGLRLISMIPRVQTLQKLDFCKVWALLMSSQGHGPAWCWLGFQGHLAKPQTTLIKYHSCQGRSQCWPRWIIFLVHIIGCFSKCWFPLLPLDLSSTYEHQRWSLRPL